MEVRKKKKMLNSDASPFRLFRDAPFRINAGTHYRGNKE